MKTTIAIDPGASGGIAFQQGDSRPEAIKMPETEGDIANTLCAIYQRAQSPESIVAYIEQVGGYTKGNPAPGSAMFNFGRNFGFLLGCLQVLRIRTELLTPGKWQKPLGLGVAGDCISKTEWKNKLKAKAQQLYPNHKVTLNTADALLILEYGRKQL